MDGAVAERQALLYLQERGLTLIERNWRCRAGELDLVMADAGTVVIAEVRSRRRDDYGTALESVDRRKRERLVRAARLLLAQRPELADKPVRFDVLTLDAAGRIEWRREAFDVDEQE